MTDRSRKRQEVDRAAWSKEVQVLLEFQTEGSGEVNTGNMGFGQNFEGVPFFTYHVELLSGELVEGDFPLVSAFVSDWDIAEISGVEVYVGAAVGIRVKSTTRYNLGFLLSFQGTAYRGLVR
jgi:hypothetical protein